MWKYNTSVTWKGGEAADLSSPGKPDLAVTPPPEFGGQAGTWTPEDLLVGAIESCTLLTFLFFVDKMKIGLTAYHSHAEGAMERTSEGLRFKSFSVHLDATVAKAEDEEKVRQAAAKAEQFCPVSAAVVQEVSLTVETHVAS